VSIIERFIFVFFWSVSLIRSSVWTAFAVLALSITAVTTTAVAILLAVLSGYVLAHLMVRIRFDWRCCCYCDVTAAPYDVTARDDGDVRDGARVQTAFAAVGIASHVAVVSFHLPPNPATRLHSSNYNLAFKKIATLI
jgi:hypothetical protein